MRQAGYGLRSQTLSLRVAGMSWRCVGRVERVLRRQPGVLSAEVNLASERARVLLLNGSDRAPLLAALAQAGYPSTPDVADRSSQRHGPTPGCTAAGRCSPPCC